MFQRLIEKLTSLENSLSVMETFLYNSWATFVFFLGGGGGNQALVYVFMYRKNQKQL